MKIQITLALLFAVLVAEAAISREKLDACPGHPGMCYKPGPPEIQLRAGETKQVRGKCEKMTCEKDGKGFILEHAGCGLAVPPPNCKLVEDLSKPYPKCCAVVKC